MLRNRVLGPSFPYLVSAYPAVTGTDPSAIFGSDLVAWWDAEDGLAGGVTAADRSGNGYSLTPSGSTAPTAAGTLNGFPAYLFSTTGAASGNLNAGSPGSLSFPGLGAAGAVFAVMSANSSVQQFGRIFSSDVGGNDYDNANSWTANFDTANTTFNTTANNTNSACPKNAYTVNESFVICFAFDAGNLYLYKNNILIATASAGGTMNIGGGAGGGNTTFALGQTSVSSTQSCLGGQIGATFVVKRTPSAEDRLAAYEYLRTRFGLTSYVGPGDLMVGAQGWWGLRAYSANAAQSGMAALRLRDAANANSADIHLLSNGSLNLSETFFSSFAGPYTIETLYDQTGNGLHLSGSTQRPGFVSTGNGLTVPHMSFVASSTQYLQTSVASLNGISPMTYIGVFRHTASATAQTILWSGVPENSINSQGADGTPNTAYMTGNAGFPVAAAVDGSWHSAQAVFTNSTGDILNIDNSAITTGVNAGSAIPAASDVYIGNSGISHFFDGFIAEAGIWPRGFSPTQQTDMYNNQHIYYGAF